MNWKAQITVAATAPVQPASPDVSLMANALLVAAGVYAGRDDSFAQGKAATCTDIAAKLRRFGSFASAKQQDYAEKLIAWAKPRDLPTFDVSARRAAMNAPAAPSLDVPKLFGVLQHHADFHVGDIKISRRNQDSLCWITYCGAPVGKIESAQVTLWGGKCARAGTSVEAIAAILRELDADPLGAAKKYGRESGRCCSCGRDLTDPASIEAGIGPVCITKFA